MLWIIIGFNADPDPGILCNVAAADPGSGSFLYPLIRHPGWAKIQDPDPGSTSGMNIPDLISESLETSFWVKNTVPFFLRSLEIN